MDEAVETRSGEASPAERREDDVRAGGRQTAMVETAQEGSNASGDDGGAGPIA